MRRNRNGSVTSPVSSPVTQALSSTPASAPLTGFRGLLVEYSGASAGYSLRKIGSGPVVRLRRISDNAEKDFAAGDVVAGTAGAELVTNGDFATDTDWTKGSNWTITGGQAVSDGTVSFGQISQNGVISAEADVYYKITFTIVACSSFTGAGTVINTNSITTFSGSWQITSTGTYSAIFRTNADNTSFSFYTATGVTMTLDDISCVPYTPSVAELWALNGKARQARQAIESAYATTWYDQSGSGNNATQATATAQPLLVRAGVTNTENGKAALSFDGVDDVLTTTYKSSTTTNSIFGVVTADSTSDDTSWMQWINSTASTGVSMGQGGLGTAAEWGLRLYEVSDTDISGIAMTTDQTLLTGLTIAATSAQIYANGVAGGLATSARLQVGQSTSIGATGGSNEFAGNIQEMVVYESDQSLNRTGIEANINDYWSIY